MKKTVNTVKFVIALISLSIIVIATLGCGRQVTYEIKMGQGPMTNFAGFASPLSMEGMANAIAIDWNKHSKSVSGWFYKLPLLPEVVSGVTVQNGTKMSVPLCLSPDGRRVIFLVVDKLMNESFVQPFLAWRDTESVKEMITEAGYVPISPQAMAALKKSGAP